MKISFVFFLSFILCLNWLSSSEAVSPPPKCYWNLDMTKAICAPPYGDIVQEINSQNYFCGLGQCVINPAGRIRCSSVVGGAAVIDSRNRASCVGGCVDATESLCVIPRY